MARQARNTQRTSTSETVKVTRPITLVAQPGAGVYQPGDHDVPATVAARLRKLGAT